MRCSVIGLGYIGLPTAALLADNGHKVFGIDINQETVSTIREGKIHIVEKGLDQIVSKVVSNGALKVYTKPKECEVFLITVPTPLENKNSDIPIPDIDHVLSAAKSISSVIKKNDLIIIESTSPVGTTDKVESLIKKYSGYSRNEVNIAYCPERVIPGRTLFELVENSRVIGGLTKKAAKAAEEFYKTFCKGKLLITNARTAELVKLTENAYRDINLAFANEISMICHESNINISELINLANHHPRVNILNPGCGVGGHCIAIDPWFIVSEHPEMTPLIQQARRVNQHKAIWAIEEIKFIVKKLTLSLKRVPKICCLGLTFKPDIDDTRNSPALFITKELIDQGYDVISCDPHIKENLEFKVSKTEYALRVGDLFICLVAHKEFKNINFNGLNVFDLCGLIK